MLPTLGSHPLQPRYTRWHATHGGTPPTLARIAYHFSNSSDSSDSISEIIVLIVISIDALNDEEERYYEIISSPWQLNCFCIIQPFLKDILKSKEGDLNYIDL